MPDLLLELTARAGLRGHLEILEAGSEEAGGIGSLTDGLSRLALTDLAKSIELWNAMKKASEGLPRVRTRVLAAGAHVLSYAGRMEEARDQLEDARRLAATLRSPGDRAAVEHASVQLLARMGRLAEAETAARGARSGYLEAGQTILAAKLGMNLGILIRMQGRPLDALEQFDAVAAELAGDAVSRGAVASNRAEALLDLDRFGEAEGAFGAALSAFQESGNLHASAIVEGNLADLFARQGRIAESVEWFERARKRFENAGAAADVARLGVEEADALASIGAAGAAADLYRSCIPTLTAAGLAREAMRAEMGFGRLLLGHGEADAALDYLRRARGRALEIGDRLAVAECDVLLAGWGEPELKDSVEVLREHPVRLAGSMLDLGWRRALNGDWAAAKEAALAADRLAEELGLRPLSARVNHLMGRVLIALGSPVEGRARLRTALRHAEGVRVELRARHLSSVAMGGGSKGRGAWEEIYRDACKAALDGMAELGKDAAFQEAFHIVERRRLRAVNEDPTSTATGGLGRRYRRCLHDLAAAYDRADGPPLTPDARREVRARIDRLEREADQLRLRIAAADPRWSSGVEPLPLEAAQILLNPNEAVLVLFSEEDMLSAFIIRHHGAELLRRFAAAEMIGRTLQRVEFAAERWARFGDDHVDEQPLIRLAELIWRPIGSMLGPDVERLGIVPHGVSAAVPWSALPLDGGAGTCRGSGLQPRESLVDRYEITVMSSVTAGLRSRLTESAVPDRPGNTLVVAKADEFAPRAESEAAVIASAIPGAVALLGANAQSDRVLAAVKEASVFHCASHAVFGYEHPISSRIRLADRWVTARELAAFVMPGSVIVLSGCETGRLSATTSTESVGLPTVLLHAGAAAVIGSLWKLSDRVAARVFPKLHMLLSEGVTPSSAIRTVQRECANDTGGRLAWGTLFVIGTMP